VSQVRVEKAGNRILVVSGQPLYGMKETIPGANFSSIKKWWSVPLDLETCALLRERFGNRLQIGPALRAWATDEKAQRESLQSVANSHDAELRVVPRVAPVLAGAMASRTYQRAAARFVADARGRDGIRRALIADTVGLGKTAEALASVIESEASGPFLVIAPKTAVNTAWTPEIRRWLPEAETITIPEGRAKRDGILDDLADWVQDSEQEDLDQTWVVLHPAAIRTSSYWICPVCQEHTKFKAGIVTSLNCGHTAKGRQLTHEHTFPQLFGIAWGAVIFDESDQSLIRLSGTPNLTRRGAEMLRDLVPDTGVRIAMSGTPFRSKPHQIWSTLNWLDPIRFSSKWNWIKKYWDLGGYSGYEIGKFREDREGMLADELSDIMIRRTRADVRADLPSKLYGGSHLNPGDETSPKGVWLDMDPKQTKAYKQMELEAFAEVEGGEISAVGVLAEMTRLKQFATSYGRMDSRGEFVPELPSNKYDWLLEFLTENGFPTDPSTKVVVVSQFTKVLNLFRAALEKDLTVKRSVPYIGMITGEITQVRREGWVERFEDPNSGVNLMLLNTKAGGSAITLDQADLMIFLDETHVDDEQEQAEGRIDNRNPERKIVPRTYYYLRSLGTIEESIAVKNAQAKREGRRILDGGRSVTALAREVLKR
jgi:SNF2 family DNA or RNA helicase